MTKYIRKLFRAVCDFVFTAECPYCSAVIEPNKYACKSCFEKFPEKPIVSYVLGKYKCVSPFPYSGMYRRAVLRFKFGNRGGYSYRLAAAAAHSIREVYRVENLDLVTCVPMHRLDVRARGYNQSRLLAENCAEILGLPYADLIVKRRRNKPQHSIGAKERARNVTGVYKISDKANIKGKNILLIDDVITTGCTLNECAGVLKNSGAGKILCAVICTSGK